MQPIYDLVVIGGGSAGLSAVGFGVEIGASVALIEKDRLGGDCTWSGCVPSKSLLKAAKVAHHIRTADRYGIEPVDPRVDLAKVAQHVQAIVNDVYAEETPEVFRARGVEVYLGAAKFLDPHTLQVGETTLQARNVILATGAHPFVPPIEGIDSVPYLTYESIFHLETLPQHLIVIGGGPIGSEMSQAFRRLGARVTQIEAGDRILSRDDPAASEVLMRVFRAEGIDIRLNRHAQKVWQDAAGIHVLAGQEEIVGDALLVAVGRRPNVAGMELEKAGVAYSPRGIQVDDKLRTTQKHIFAAGDCVGSYQFTHYAGWQANMAARNALFPGAAKGVRAWVPWCTFTDPEVAHVGLTVAEAREKYGEAVELTTLPMTRVDRARAELDSEGFVQLAHKGGQVLGVTLVAERAGELIQEWYYVVEKRLETRDVTTAIHPYPSYGQANVRAGGALLQKVFLLGRLGRVVNQASRLALTVMRWQRRVG